MPSPLMNTWHRTAPLTLASKQCSATPCIAQYSVSSHARRSSACLQQCTAFTQSDHVHAGMWHINHPSKDPSHARTRASLKSAAARTVSSGSGAAAEGAADPQASQELNLLSRLQLELESALDIDSIVRIDLVPQQQQQAAQQQVQNQTQDGPQANGLRGLVVTEPVSSQTTALISVPLSSTLGVVENTNGQLCVVAPGLPAHVVAAVQGGDSCVVMTGPCIHGLLVACIC